MAALPPIRSNPYNQQMQGVYGEFGSGAGLRAFYLQSAIPPAALDRISLISDIKGSERWPIRDLFQRDVDDERVTGSLLPYLQDVEKIKFFNPLTLTVLPMDAERATVLRQMPKVVDRTVEEDGARWRSLERERFYRVRWVEGHHEWAQLEWNDEHSRLVAIDGQHRLSALKRFAADEAAGRVHQHFMQWRIPVVVVSFRAHGDREEPPSVLDVVRSIFVYINTQAQTVNEARAILLSDESINAVCTQELLQKSHENDNRTPAERDTRIVPLLLYDWRGEERKGKRIVPPAAIKTVEEIHNWFAEYVFDDDFGEKQETALRIDPSHPLKKTFHDESLTYADSKLVRARFRETVLSALSHLFEHFVPYRDYAAGLRAIEQDFCTGSRGDLGRHAFDELRFGASHGIDSIRAQVKSELLVIEGRVEELRRHCLRKPLDEDIGMRGVIWAFGTLPAWLGHPDWLTYAQWFTAALNQVYEAGWIDLEPKARKYRDLLRHVAEDHHGDVVNYRLQHAGRALGAYVALLVAAYGAPWPEAWGGNRAPFQEETLDELRATVMRGYRKEVRPLLREEFPNGGKELTDAVNTEAQKRARRQIRRFEKLLREASGTTGG